MRFLNTKDFLKFSDIIYGVIRLDGNYLEIDIKDDETEEFFKSLV